MNLIYIFLFTVSVWWLTPPAQVFSALPAGFEADPVEIFWESLAALCGNAYQGDISRAPDMDRYEDGWVQIMHVNSCEEDRIYMRFVEDRLPFQMVRVFMRHHDGSLELRHDYRNPDGTPAIATRHGGRTTNPGSGYAQIFPADTYMVEHAPPDWQAPWEVVWRIEVHPRERFVYFNQRTGISTGYEWKFDLSKTVEPPPLWGWEE